MQLPIDLKALLDEATDIKRARETDIAVGVYIDDTAPAGLIAHVRNAFASASAHVRMTISYLGAGFVPLPTDDLAVIVAGNSAEVGADAAALRAVGVPVMVVTLQPEAVERIAEEHGNAIPEGDIVSLEHDQAASVDSTSDLSDEVASSLDERMGRWIVAACRDKRLAYAVSFPFARRPLAKDAVLATSMQNAGVGLVPLLPGADLPVMTLNQAKMVLQIAAAYGQEMDKNRFKELAAVVGGAYACRTLARELVEFVPVLGFAIRTGIAYGGTAALGYAVIEYFEGGEDITGVANVAAKAAEAGGKVVSKAKEVAADPRSLDVAGKLGKYASTARERIGDAAPVVREAAQTYIPKIVDAATEAVSSAAAR